MPAVSRVSGPLGEAPHWKKSGHIRARTDDQADIVRTLGRQPCASEQTGNRIVEDWQAQDLLASGSECLAELGSYGRSLDVINLNPFRPREQPRLALGRYLGWIGETVAHFEPRGSADLRDEVRLAGKELTGAHLLGCLRPLHHLVSRDHGPLHLNCSCLEPDPSGSDMCPAHIQSDRVTCQGTRWAVEIRW